MHKKMAWAPNAPNTYVEEYDDLDPYEHELQTMLPTALRPINCAVDTDAMVFDDETLKTRRAELIAEMCANIGVPQRKVELKKWDHQQEDDADEEITKVLRSVGLEPEPSPCYRPNSKTTSRTAIQSELPVPGFKDLCVTRDLFNFKNPYFTTPAQVEQRSGAHIKREHVERTSVTTAQVEENRDAHIKRTSVGVAGEEYMSTGKNFCATSTVEPVNVLYYEKRETQKR